MKFSSFYTGFFVENVDENVKLFESMGFSVKHRTGGDGYSMVIMELPKGDRIGIIKAPEEMGSGKMITLANVDNIEEGTEFFCREFGCTKLGGIAEKPSTKFQNVIYNGHLITLMEHTK